MKKVIIIGNGPAGVSASLYTVRAGIDTVIIGNGLGSLGKADKIENYYGFEFPISGSELIQKGIAQAKRLGVSFISQEVVSIDFFDRTFSVKTDTDKYFCDAIILATGSSRTAPLIKGLTELEGQGVSYCAVCDAFFYKGKDIAVMGSGDYALNEVNELMPIVNSVTLLTNGVEPTVSFPPEVKIKKQVISSLNPGPSNPLFGGIGSLESITFKDTENSKENNEIKLDGVFIAYGTAGSSALAKKLGAFTDGNKISVNPDMSTNVPGLYAAGDCVGGLLQISKAVGDGAIAGTSVVKYLR